VAISNLRLTALDERGAPSMEDDSANGALVRISLLSDLTTA